jgi:hypothetical protein
VTLGQQEATLAHQVSELERASRCTDGSAAELPGSLGAKPASRSTPGADCSTSRRRATIGHGATGGHRGQGQRCG